MPYHLELGSEGHSFHGKAIVVNSQTGEHKSKHPLPADIAGAHMRALNAKEAPKEKKPKKAEEPPLKMMKTKHEAQKEKIPEREEEGVKEVKAKKKGMTSLEVIQMKKAKEKGPKLVENGGFREGTDVALRDDPFLKKCFGEGQDMDDFIFNMRMIVTGSKKDLDPRWTRDYNRNVYDLGEFFSRRFPKNANNVKIPARTAKLIKTISSEWELLIMGTGDDNGRDENVVMTLLTI